MNHERHVDSEIVVDDVSTAENYVEDDDTVENNWQIYLEIAEQWYYDLDFVVEKGPLAAGCWHCG